MNTDENTVNTKLVGSDAYQVRINSNENKEYDEQIDWNENVTSTPQKVKREDNEELPSFKVIEKKVFVENIDTPIFRAERYDGRRFCVDGPRKTRQVLDHTIRTKKYFECERDVITYPNGVVSFGEWRIIRTWIEVISI